MHASCKQLAGRSCFAFTLIEVLVVVAIISMLISILLPALDTARSQARDMRCLLNLRTIGQGLTLYAHDFKDLLVPGRLPQVDNCTWAVSLHGRLKFRPNFLAMSSLEGGVPAFQDPMSCVDSVDRFGDAGDRQDFSDLGLICSQASEWTDERNSSYGYNYQFLGNARLSDAKNPASFKNWPVSLKQIRYTSRTIAAADSMGSAAAYPADERQAYDNDGNDTDCYGNEGATLDPPRIDPLNGEFASVADSQRYRSAAAPRHSSNRANVLFVDAHAEPMSLSRMGYLENPDGSVALDGDNTMWSGTGEDVAWTPAPQP